MQADEALPKLKEALKDRDLAKQAPPIRYPGNVTLTKLKEAVFCAIKHDIWDQYN